MKLTQTLFTCSLLGLAACGEPMPEQAAQVIESRDVGQVAQLLRHSKPVPGEYIVVLRDDVKHGRELAQAMASAHGGEVLVAYETVLRGFAVRMPEIRALQLLKDPRVKYIEENGYAQTSGTQTGATWGLDRIDQTSLPLNGLYNYNHEGVNVHAYILDTGVRLTHSEFTGRMGIGYDAVTVGGTADDCNGHGTHVAGTVAGATWGVAKKAIVHPVRVMECAGPGYVSNIIKGMDWVASNHTSPAVANLSVATSASASLDDAVQRLYASGVVVVVAAGNQGFNACDYSPSRAPTAITVGSTSETDARSDFSNYGACVDIFAPGANITSASHASDTASTLMSGTSMATPHVVGVAALYLGANPAATPQQVRDALVSGGTVGKVTNAGLGSPNVLLNSLNPPPPPVCSPMALSNGVAVSNISVPMGAWTCAYSLSVPAGASTLAFDMSGGSGDGDMYVKFGSAPTNTSYDCRPYRSGSAEGCSFTNPAAGTWYVKIYGYATTSGLSLKGTYSTGGTSALVNGVATAAYSGASGSWTCRTLSVPSGKTSVVFNQSGETGNSGDADLYVKFGSAPTASSYDCRPYQSGSTETCTISNPSAGTWYACSYGYIAYTNVTMKGTY